MEQLRLFSDSISKVNNCGHDWRLPQCHDPQPVGKFNVDRIVLSKGSLATADRRQFVERVCLAYPTARILDYLDVPHNRIEMDEAESAVRHRKGKSTLVFGELRDSVRFSHESGIACPNYWHFSVYGFCPFGCRYCYLAGTQGIWFSPTVKIFVNLPEIIGKIDRIARRIGKSTAFYSGKLQDGVALDPLTAYSTVLVPFFASHPYARQTILTKSDAIERFLDLDHKGRTTLSWSLNPPEIASRFETNVPSVESRMLAMQRCAERGYPVRAVIMPIIPCGDWRALYHDFVWDLIKAVHVDRLTLGGICIYRRAMMLMDHFLGKVNVISASVKKKGGEQDGRIRYRPETRIEFYRHLITAARNVRPDLDIALCLETTDVWKAVGLSQNIGRCNCLL